MTQPLIANIHCTCGHDSGWHFGYNHPNGAKCTKDNCACKSFESDEAEYALCQCGHWALRHDQNIGKCEYCDCYNFDKKRIEATK